MRQVIILIPILFTVTLYGQKRTAIKNNNNDTINLVSFTVKFDKKNATKDGYYLGGYVVNINYDLSNRLNGKNIKITGKVSIEKGLDSDASKHNTSDTFPIMQGRSGDTKHIESPIIEIVTNQN